MIGAPLGCNSFYTDNDANPLPHSPFMASVKLDAFGNVFCFFVSRIYGYRSAPCNVP